MPERILANRAGRNVLFVYGGMTGFVARDLSYISNRCGVVDLKMTFAFGSFRRLIAGLRSCDTLYCWFAGRHALIPVLLGRLMGLRIVVVAGGYDVACEPEINYGSMRPGWKRFLTRVLLRAADLVVCVSDFNREEAVRNAGVLPEKIRVVRHGFADTKIDSAARKERIVLTVGEVMRDNLDRKGLDAFARASRLVADARWVVAGRVIDETGGVLASLGGGNLEVTGYLEGHKLLELMRRAKVYVQASRHEAFGCALAEAMVEGCIPIVTERGAMPEVVGPSARFVPWSDPDALARAVRETLDADVSEGIAARERILSRFSRQEWERAMDRLFDEIQEGTAK